MTYQEFLKQKEKSHVATGFENIAYSFRSARRLRLCRVNAPECFAPLLFLKSTQNGKYIAKSPHAARAGGVLS